jgi:hypothetical protein
MSGIYGPILTALTLIVLIRQVQLQQATNKHSYDQAYLQNAKADIDFYFEQLVKALEEHDGPGPTVRTTIATSFERANIEALQGDVLKASARRVNARFPQVQAIWAAIYSIYAGMGSNKEAPFRLHFTSAQQKAIVLLSFPTCVALDHYLYCITEGRLRY